MQKIIIILVTLMLFTSISQAQDLKQDAMNTYADIVFASYEDSLSLAEDLQTAINAFLANPSEDSLSLARTMWLLANEPYGQTEVYRFYGGPIDDEDGPEGLLNAWPLDEAYVDYVEGAPEVGIINNADEFPTIDKDLLLSLNEVGAEENISTGYHAIEFLLWGQDLSADTNGQRPYTDYTTAANAERRGAYLAAAAELLVEHLGTLVEAWDPAVSGNYRESFLALEPDDAINNMLTGMGVLAKSELAGERIFTAFDNQDQEDEHSCFSDNTHRDIVTNFKGIENVYLGRYVRLNGQIVNGVGLEAVVAEADAGLNASMLELLAQADTATVNLAAPFDQAIVTAEGRPQVMNLVTTLLDLGDTIAEVGTGLGLTINTALPE
ncbi:MAG: imelysin family protein [Deinococcota bacterium]